MIISYPEDVAELKQKIRILAEWSDEHVVALYEFWSQEHYQASWMYVSADNVNEFQEWLLKVQDM